MKPKRYIRGISFMATNELYEKLQQMAKEEELGLGELIRHLIVEQLNQVQLNSNSIRRTQKWI